MNYIILENSNYRPTSVANYIEEVCAVYNQSLESQASCGFYFNYLVGHSDARRLGDNNSTHISHNVINKRTDFLITDFPMHSLPGDLLEQKRFDSTLAQPFSR